MPNDALVKELLEAEQGDKALLYSDAMDSAVTVYCTQGYLMRDESGDGEFFVRRRLAAAFRAFLENTPESDLVRLARPPAPHGIGVSPGDDPVAEGPQAVARFLSTPSVSAPGDEGREREIFVEWLESLEPSLPTTHDVKVAWRAWLARAGKVCTCDQRADVTEPLCPACSDSYESAALSTPPEPQAVLEGEVLDKIIQEIRDAKQKYVSPAAPRTGFQTQQAYDYLVSLVIGRLDTLLDAAAPQRRIVPMDDSRK